MGDSFTKFSDTAEEATVRHSSSRSTARRGGGSGGRYRREHAIDPEDFTAELEGEESYSVTVPVTRWRTVCVPTSGSKHSIKAVLAEDETLAAKMDGLELTEKTIKQVLDRTHKQAESAIRAISRAQRVVLCFLLDTTGSMWPHIKKVCEDIMVIVDTIKGAGCHVAGVGFVGYKDWCDGIDHFEALPFTRDLEEFSRFVEAIRPGGGGDQAEDVLGGIQRALRLPWNCQDYEGCTKVLFHMADAPPHGRMFQGPGIEDDLPEGHSDDPTPEHLFQSMADQQVLYIFGRINDTCDEMVRAFSRAQSGGKDTPVADVSDVANILSSVTASVMNSVAATTASVCARGSRCRLYRIEKKESDFSERDWQTASVLSMDFPRNVDEILRFERPLPSTCKKATIRVAPHPFDKGSVRLAYFGEMKFGKADGRAAIDQHVFKEYIKLPAKPKTDRSRYMVDLETATIAAYMAQLFMREFSKNHIKPPYSLKFLKTKVIRMENGSGRDRYRFMASEKRFRGKVDMIKYNNNYKFVRTVSTEGTTDAAFKQKSKMCQAFSHFSFVASKGYLLVCDLQGIETTDARDRDTILLTDPAIHCTKHPRFGSTNMRSKGVSAFFDAHTCNEYCDQLHLRASAPLIKHTKACMSQVKVPPKKNGKDRKWLLDKVEQTVRGLLSSFWSEAKCAGYCSTRRNVVKKTKDAEVADFVKYKAYCAIVHTFEKTHGGHSITFSELS